MNRRTMIAATAATAITGPALAVTPSTELADLITAHKAGLQRSIAAIDQLEEIEAAYFAANGSELVVDLSIGGAQSASLKYDMERAEYDCRKAIARRYVEVISRCDPLSKIDPPLARAARSVFVKGRARDMARLRSAMRKETAKREAFGFAQAERDRDAAWDAEFAALEALLAFKPLTVADSDAKGRYLLSAVGGRYASLSDEQAEILFRSLTTDPEPVEA